MRHLLIKPTAGKLENLFSLISSHISERIFSVSCAQTAFTFEKQGYRLLYYDINAFNFDGFPLGLTACDLLAYRNLFKYGK